MMFNTYSVDPDTGFIMHETDGSDENESILLESETYEADTNASDIYGDSSDVPEIASDLEASQDRISVVDGDIVHISPAPSPVDLSGSGSAPVADGMVIYDVTVSGYGACKFVVSPDVADKIEVVDGTLINWGSSDVSGALYVGEIGSPAAVDCLRLTLLGRGSSNYASNYYRYGSPQYVTYYQTSNAYLQSYQSYVSLSDAKQASWSFSFWVSVIVVVCLLLLAVNALIRLIRRGVRG